jgi:RNA polymerase sigma-70 factor (ECF subfamily)
MAQVWLPARRRASLAVGVRVSVAGVWARGAFSPRLLTIGRDGERSRPAARPATEQADARQAQFERWFAQYRLPLLDYLYGMTRDREWAADLVQEAFLRAYAASGDPDAIGQPRAWLYRIATNTALTALRRRKRFTWLPLAVVEPQPGASSSDRWMRPGASVMPVMPSHDFVVGVAERDAVWRTLAELPPRWRSVLILHATAGFEVGEIAAQLGLSEANVRKILFRAKERFRELHGRNEANEHPGTAWGGSR